MNARVFIVCAGVLGAISCMGGDASPSLKMAMDLFSPDSVASTNICLLRKGGQHMKFNREYLKMSLTRAEYSRLESFIFHALTSIVVHVSPNVVNDGVKGWVIEDRARYFKWLIEDFHDFKTNDVECLAVASYIGRVRTVDDFPSYWGNRRDSTLGPILLSTNAAEVAEHNRRVAEERRALRKVQDLQRRVYQTNRAVREYRRNLCAICGIAVDGCSSVMAPEEFAAFTNRIVEVSGASQEEQDAMFDLLNRHRRGR